jgi:hypothetical protein
MKSYNSLSLTSSRHFNTNSIFLKSFFRLYGITATSAQLSKIWKKTTINYVKPTQSVQSKLKCYVSSQFLSEQGQLFLLLNRNFQLTSVKSKVLLSWINKILQSLLYSPSLYTKNCSLVQNELVSFKKSSLFL